jgi:ketosteroid isomerase-like protein
MSRPSGRQGTESTPEALMRRVTKGFAANDTRPLMEVIDDKTVWKSASAPSGPFQFGGAYRGRAGIAQVTSSIFSSYTFHRFEAKEIVERGEIAWGLFEVEGSYHPQKDRNRPAFPFRYECALRWRVRNGKLIEYQSFFDTASLLHQQGELNPPPRP